MLYEGRLERGLLYRTYLRQLPIKLADQCHIFTSEISIYEKIQVL